MGQLKSGVFLEKASEHRCSSNTAWQKIFLALLLPANVQFMTLIKYTDLNTVLFVYCNLLLWPNV